MTENINDLKSSKGKKDNAQVKNIDSKTHLTNSINMKTSFNSSINYYDNKNERNNNNNNNNNNNRSWLEKFDTKLTANEIRTSSQIDLDLLDDGDGKTHVLKRNNFVSTELPSDEIYDGNASDRNNYFDENVLNSNELDSNDLASSIENFVNEEEEEEVVEEEIYTTHCEIRNEKRILSNEENSVETNTNEIRAVIVAREIHDENNINKVTTENVQNGMNDEKNEKESTLILSNNPIENGQLNNAIISSKVVHHIHTSIAPFQSTLMNDFDNQYLWDYSDNNKFQKF